MSSATASALTYFLSLQRHKADRLFAAFAFGMFLLELVVIATMQLSLSPDEAYYWEWSRQLDLAYFDKGPIVPLIIRFFCSILGNSEFAIRLGALLCHTAFITLLYLFVRSRYSPGLGLLSSVLVWSTLIFASQGLFMTNDPPLSILYLLAVGWAADTIRSGNPRGWIKTLAVTGFAIVCKFTALILYPGIFAFLLFTPKERFHLKRPEFWIGTLLMFCALVPTLLWNIQHDWPQLGYNAHHLLGQDGPSIRPRKAFELIGGQWALLGALTFPLLCLSLYLGAKEWRRGDSICGLYLASSLPLALICLAVSFRQSCYANWPMPVYIGATLTFVHLVNKEHAVENRAFRWLLRKLKLALELNFLMFFVAHIFLTGESLGLPRERLPMKKAIGWRELAEELEPIRNSTTRCWKSAAGSQCEHPAIVAQNYAIGSTLAFYLSDHPQVFIQSDRKTIRNQYDLWGGWEKLKGRDAIIVLDDLEQLVNFEGKFESIEPLAARPTIDRMYDGELFVRTYLFLGRNYDGSRG